jgi:cell division protein FtsQ
MAKDRDFRDREFEEEHLRRQKKREIKRHREGRPFWKTAVVWSCRMILASLAVVLGVSLFRFASTSQAFELKELKVLGASRVDVTEIRRVIRREFHRNLFRIRLQKVQEFLEGQPWVQSAQVLRVFPDKLKILLVERRPVALAKIENELFLVDRHGVLLEPYGSRFQHLDLAVVRGLENSTQGNVSAGNETKMEAVMQLLSELDSGPERLSDKISEIDVSDPTRVALVPTDQPIKVYLGDSDYRERFQTYLSKLSLMSDLAAKYGAMDSVDLSIKHRIIFHTKNGSGASINVKNEQSG